MKYFGLVLFSSFLITSLLAQTDVSVEGYVFEQKNRGYLNQVEISISELKTGQELYSGETNLEGYFSCSVPANMEFIISAKKSAFHTLVKDFSSKKTDDSKLFLSLEMEREPGYIFEATLAPTRDSDHPVDAIIGARIEIYNNTKGKQEVLIPSATSYTFNHPLLPGNHYTMLIRKKGFYNKRIEAYVDIEGCILCFEGTGEVRPGVTDNLTDGLTKGSLLSNIEMEPIELGKGIVIPDIYYDYDKANIRSDAKAILDELIVLLKNNPALIVEMGSHTDSRGRDEYNRSLAEKRAEAVVEYLIDVGNIRPVRLSAFGYGESEIKNRCLNGVACSEAEHQENRRTEMKVVGILDYDPFQDLTLEQIIIQENSEALLQDMIDGRSEQIQAGSFDDLPEEVKRDILRSRGEKYNDQKNEDKEEVNHEQIIDSSDEDNSPPNEPISSEEKSTNDQSQSIERIMTFEDGFDGYSVYLGKLPGPTEHVENMLLEKHGKIYERGAGRYYLGKFDSKKQAKKYLKSLTHMYPSAKVESIK